MNRFHIHNFNGREAQLEWVLDHAKFYIVLNENSFWGYTAVDPVGKPAINENNTDYFSNVDLAILREILNNMELPEVDLSNITID